MGTITIVPEEFRLVLFDAGRLRELVEQAVKQVGLPETVDVRVEVNEESPLARTRLESLEPLVITAESGAFDDPRHPRRLSDAGTLDVLGRLLFRAKDRLDPAFGTPPPDAELNAQF